jgi:hypothetical protein
LKLEELAELMKERGPTEEENPRDAPHKPLRIVDRWSRLWSGRTACRWCCWRDRELRRQQFRDLNTLDPHLAGHCPVRTLYPG